MPTVFHELVLFTDDSFIVLDEIWFVNFSYVGKEIWYRQCDDIIETYELSNSSITGKTMEGSKFDFPIN